MENYYLSLARSMMSDALAKLEKADEYLALASRKRNNDYDFRRNLRTSKRKIAAEMERAANVMQDKCLSEN